MKLRINFKSKKFWGGLVVAVAAIGASLFAATPQIDAAGCPTNDIMPCGAWTPSQFVSKLKANNPSDMDNIYANWRYKLPTSQYDRFAAKAKPAKINPDNGNITVNGITVGLDAQSIGRNPKSVSRPISIDGKTYYESPIRLLTKYYNDAMVLFDEKGNVQTVVMNLCGNPMTVNPKNPSYNCDALNVNQVDRDTYSFNTSVSLANGASVSKVVYDFGDGTTSTQTSPATTVTHDYREGSFTAKVTVYIKTTFSESEFPITVTANCQKPITVAPAPAPKVDIVKTVDGVERKEVALNTEFKYNLKVTNTGNVNLANVVVTDKAPANVVFVATDKGTIVDNALNYTVPSLAKGTSVTINITAKLTKYVAGDIKNTACIETPTIPGTNPDDCDDAVITTPTPKVPRVDIDKKVNGKETAEVALNEEFTYQLVVKNTGEVDLVNVMVSDSEPAGIRFISTDKGNLIANATTNALSYTIPSLKVGESVTINIKAKAIKASVAPVKNTACVNAPEVPGTPDDCDDATTTTPEPPAPKTPGVNIDKKVNGKETAEVKLNEEFTYQLVVKNTGEVDLTNVKVSDSQPEGIQFIRTDKGSLIGNATTYALSYTIPSLKVGESVTINITAKATKYSATAVKNTACVDAPELNGAPDDCDDATTTTPEPNKVSVCNPETRTIIQVPEADKDKYLPVDSPKCEKIEVCVKDSGDTTLKPIYKDEFDASKHSTNPEDCKKPATPTPTPTPQTPPTTPQVLPSTGPEAVLGSLVGSSALTYGAYSYLASRRALKSVR
jgi:fimbrial isopeptide formation D2 family protein/uncharacterized repeat protein (TIGR01451 family)